MKYMRVDQIRDRLKKAETEYEKHKELDTYRREVSTCLSFCPTYIPAYKPIRTKLERILAWIIHAE